MLQNQSQQGLILEDHHQYHQAAALGMMGFLSNQNPSSNNLAFLQPHDLNDQPISIKPFGSMLGPWTLSDEADEGDDLNGQATTSTDLCQSLCADQNPREFHHQDPYNLVGGKKKKSLVGVSELRMKKMKGRRKTREPRFSFKTLTDVDVLDDGYKWRKYGQKVVKNTHHPRSYYRCTQDNCRVKKRVERLAEDPRMVITTYEGRHVHSPCPDNPEDDSNKSLPILNNFF